jgi:hypothetical protein
LFIKKSLEENSAMNWKIYCYLIIIVLMLVIIVNFTSFGEQKFGDKKVKTGQWKGKSIEYIDREIAIRIKQGFTKEQIIPVLNNFHARLRRDFDDARFGWIEVPDTIDIMPVISTLQSNELVETVEPILVTRTYDIPNDPDYSKQWGLNNTGQTPPGGKVDADIDAQEAWDITTGNTDVIVAILDTVIPVLKVIITCFVKMPYCNLAH